MSRISVDEARTLWHEGSDEELKRLAQEVRARYHEPNHATYMVMRIINYTNVCVAQCDYCAFYVLPNQEGGYVLSRGCRSTTTATYSRPSVTATASGSSSTR